MLIRTMMKKILFLMFAFIVHTAQAQQHQRGAVLDFEYGENISEEAVGAISYIFSSNFYPSDYQMLPPIATKRLIKDAGYDNTTNLNRDQKRAIGRALGVSIIVDGDVTLFMDEYNADIRVINVETGATVVTSNVSFERAKYRDNMKSLAINLANKVNQKSAMSNSAATNGNSVGTNSQVQPAPSVAQNNNRTFTANGVQFTMIFVEGGTFQMGNNDGDEDEHPMHNVTLSDYYIGQTEVTQKLWTAVMGSNPSYFKGDDLPVEKVSWNDCQTFINKLNQLTGEIFRLPTEAEWEFAAKGGNKSKGYTYSGHNMIEIVAWFISNSGSQTHPVGTKAPNELGIYDMSGNVWEWCYDWYGSYSGSAQTNPAGPSSGSVRVHRGGAWSNDTPSCHTAYRYYSPPIGAYSFLGFRLAL